MSFYHDKQIKIYGCFLAVFGFLIAGAWLLFYLYQTNSVKIKRDYNPISVRLRSLSVRPICLGFVAVAKASELGGAG